MIALAAVQLRPGDRVLRLHDDGERRPAKVETANRVSGEQIAVTYEDGSTARFGQLDRVRIAER